MIKPLQQFIEETFAAFEFEVRAQRGNALVNATDLFIKLGFRYFSDSDIQPARALHQRFDPLIVPALLHHQLLDTVGIVLEQ